MGVVVECVGVRKGEQSQQWVGLDAADEGAAGHLECTRFVSGALAHVKCDSHPN